MAGGSRVAGRYRGSGKDSEDSSDCHACFHGCGHGFRNDGGGSLNVCVAHGFGLLPFLVMVDFDLGKFYAHGKTLNIAGYQLHPFYIHKPVSTASATDIC